MERFLRLVGYIWTLPNTLLGLVLGLLSLQRPRVDDGVVVFDRAPRGFLWLFARLTRFRAITYGHVILSAVPLGGLLLRHERHHVAQYEVLGPLYLPTYVALWAVRGYTRHPFEVEARESAARPTAPRSVVPSGPG